MRAVFEIRSITVLNRKDARPPTRLTVAQKGWFHLTRLKVFLTLTPLEDSVHATRAPGNITLVQKFIAGRAPAFNTRTRSSFTLELQLWGKGRLRTRAWATVGDLLEHTKHVLAWVPFEVKVGRKVEKAFVQVAQVSPVPTPDPPPGYPLRCSHSTDVIPSFIFPPPSAPPTAHQVKQLVDAIYGPSADKTDWSKPFTFGPSIGSSTSPPLLPQLSHSDVHNSSTAASPSVTGAMFSAQHSSSKRVGSNIHNDVHYMLLRQNLGCPMHGGKEDTAHSTRQQPAIPQQGVKGDTPHSTRQQPPIPQHGVKGDTTHSTTQQPSIPQHDMTGDTTQNTTHQSSIPQHGGKDNTQSNAPQASRQEAGYAYVQLWEFVFGKEIPNDTPQQSAISQHRGDKSEDVLPYAPQATRQEVGYAYVKLWEYVFGES